MQQDFIGKIQRLIQKIQSEKDLVKSEADTESVFVEPFLEILGYKASDARTLKRQYPASFGTKGNDSKVDYAILENDKPLIIIEVKHYTVKLDDYIGQLKGYFAACIKTCHFGILCNGIVYYFFSNIQNEREMDIKPFFHIDLAQGVFHKEMKFLQKFVKGVINPSEIRKYIQQMDILQKIESKITKEIQEPSDEFVRFFKEISGKQNLQGRTKREFVQSIKQAFENVIDTKVQARIKELQSKNIQNNNAKLSKKHKV